MIARLDHLRAHPSVFRHLTGLTVPAFDTLAAEVVPAVEAAHRKTLDRPDRQRAIGAGGAFGLTTAVRFSRTRTPVPARTAGAGTWVVVLIGPSTRTPR